MVTARAPEKLTHISLLLVQTPTDTNTTPKLTYNDGHIRGVLHSVNIAFLMINIANVIKMKIYFIPSYILIAFPVILVK